VFGGTACKRVKWELDRLSDDNERAFRWKGRVHPSHPQPRSHGYPERVRMSALEFRLAETLGGTE
jgi:hypothetical protein